MTQADLARATGIRPNTINELYHELTERVNLEQLDLICEALDCELDELIVRVPNKEPAVVHTRQGTRKIIESAATLSMTVRRGVASPLLIILSSNR